MNSLKNLFNFNSFSSAIALVSSNRKVTYSELEELSSNIPNFDDQSLVLLVCTNTIDSIIAYFQIIKSGAVCILIKERNFDFLVKTYKPSYIYAPSDIKYIEGSLIHNIGSYNLYKINAEIDYKINDRLSIMLSTSGSTGTPKFVKISDKNIISNTLSISNYLNITDSDRAITTMPMNYSYGLSIIHTHLYKGGSLVVTDSSLMSRELWSLMDEKNVTNFGGVPYTYQMLKKLRFERMELPSLRYITQAGGRISSELATYIYEICKEKGIDFFIMYGQTEATARISYLPPKFLPKKKSSIGIPIPEGELFIKDENGEEIKSINTKGELIYKGDNVFMGYSMDCYDLKEDDLNQGYLETGDLAEKDEDDLFSIVGRKNRFIKVFGNRVNLDEFENIISSYGINCACTGYEDKIFIFTLDSSIDDLGLFNYLMDETGLNKTAFEIVMLDSFPRNESGKIIYSKLKKKDE